MNINLMHFFLKKKTKIVLSRSFFHLIPKATSVLLSSAATGSTFGHLTSSSAEALRSLQIQILRQAKKALQFSKALVLFHHHVDNIRIPCLSHEFFKTLTPPSPLKPPSPPSSPNPHQSLLNTPPTSLDFESDNPWEVCGFFDIYGHSKASNF